MSTQFVSQAKLDANRANAQHSTGPRTIGGKTTSSSNGMKLGFNAARFVVLPEENREDFDKLRERLRAEHKPATDTESILVDNMAKHHWLMNRALHHQNVCVDLFNEVAEKRLALMIRYQTTHERAFHRNLNQLLNLRKACQAQEVGFVSQKDKMLSMIRKAEAEKLKIQLLRAKVEKVQKPAKASPAPHTPEISVSENPNVTVNTDPTVEKTAPAAA